MEYVEISMVFIDIENKSIKLLFVFTDQTLSFNTLNLNKYVLAKWATFSYKPKCIFMQ